MIDKKKIIDFCKKYNQEEFLSSKNNITYYLWSPEEIEELNSQHNIEKLIPGFYGFGTDEGDELLVVSMKDGKVYSVPFIPMKIENAVQIAEGLDEFLGYKK